MRVKIRLLAWLFVAMSLISLAGCAAEESLVPVTPIEETYEYTTTGRVYARPAMLTVEQRVEFLTLTVDDGFFFCATTDTEEADEFINAQRTLLQFLRDSGVEIQKLNYYAIDFDDSFSENEKKRGHIAFSDVKSYQQVLVTLQTLWGDYTDYGYIHAVANTIAAHLGWQTDSIEEVDQTALATFFAENPEALNLVYPCFTTAYASEETVRNCKALSKQLVERIELREALTKPIDEQVNDFCALVDTYAQEISVTFSRQESRYAYYGEYIPLKISTPYVEHFIDRNYEDEYLAALEKLGDDSWDYFVDYLSIFATLDIINEEIARSVAYFGLEDEVGVVAMYWLSADSAAELHTWMGGHRITNYYNSTPDDPLFDGKIRLTRISSYLHEYFHHIEHLINPNLGQTWQSQTFADLGSAQSQHARRFLETASMSDELSRELFYAFFGREYQSCWEDYYNVYDMTCYLNHSYQLEYLKKEPWNSFAHYLLGLYGEEIVPEILLFPETVEEVTGKTWEILQSDWQRHLEEKFKDVEIPDWVYE